MENDWNESLKTFVHEGWKQHECDSQCFASLLLQIRPLFVPEAYRPALITPFDCDSSGSPRAAHSCLVFWYSSGARCDNAVHLGDGLRLRSLRLRRGLWVSCSPCRLMIPP